jgi:hypothetical protein
MMKFHEILQEVELLPASEKWRLVKHMLETLEQSQTISPSTSWAQFLQETYGSLRDTPIQRWNQGDYEEREPLE